MILEMRTYVLKPGMTHNFVERFAEGLTARLQFSKLLGLWLSEVGGLNRVVHVWPYESFEDRERIGAEAIQANDIEEKARQKHPEESLAQTPVRAPSQHEHHDQPGRDSDDLPGRQQDGLQDHREDQQGGEDRPRHRLLLSFLRRSESATCHRTAWPVFT